MMKQDFQQPSLPGMPRSAREAARMAVEASLPAGEEALIDEVRASLTIFDRAYRSLDLAGVNLMQARIGVILDKLHAIYAERDAAAPRPEPVEVPDDEAHEEFDIVMGPQFRRDRFGRAPYDSYRSVLAKVAAPAGAVPMWGQPGRFVLVAAHCRCDVMYQGLGGVGGWGSFQVHAVDWKLPFISETGYRSFATGEPALFDHGVDEYCRQMIEGGQLVTWEGKHLTSPMRLRAIEPFFEIGRGARREKIVRGPHPNDPAWWPAKSLRGRAGFIAELVAREHPPAIPDALMPKEARPKASGRRR